MVKQPLGKCNSLQSEKLVKDLELKTSQLKEGLRTAFDLFDMDHDGKVTNQELLDIMYLMGIDKSHELVKTLLHQLDHNPKHLMDYDEFEIYITPFMKHQRGDSSGRRLSRRLSLVKQEDSDALAAMFQYFDTDNTGYIEATRLRAKLEALSGMRVSSEEFEEVTMGVGIDKNGKVNYTQFMRLMEMEIQPLKTIPASASEISDEMMMLLFEEFDEDGNGFIEAHELRIKLSEWTGQDLSLEETKKIVAQVDVNGDGVVDFDEFCILMGRIGEN